LGIQKFLLLKLKRNKGFYWIKIVCFRVLRPPGGGSSNIFGGAEPEAPKQQVRREMAQQSPATQTQSPSNPTTDANNEYQKNKPKGKGMCFKVLLKLPEEKSHEKCMNTLEIDEHVVDIFD
jgi:hypothetical protein